jgi:hypothetical protein
MAGDWIKMRINLDSDPRVIEIASELKNTRAPCRRLSVEGVGVG